MKLSAKKKGQIYNAVHETLMDLRIDLRNNYLPTTMANRDKIDFSIAQIEAPLAQKIMCLLDKNYGKELDKELGDVIQYWKKITQKNLTKRLMI